MAESSLLPNEKEQLLIDKTPELMTKIKISSSFWAQLKKCGAITHPDVIEIQTQSHNPQDQVYKLVEHLMRGTKAGYQGFLQALLNTQQHHIVTAILGEEGLHQHQPAQHGKSSLNVAFNPPWRDKVRLLKQKTAALKKHIKLSQEFCDSLVYNHVLSHLEIENFKNDGTCSESEQIQSLIEYLIRGTKKTYRGFLYALSETDQLEVTKDILGEDVPDLYMLTDHLQGDTATDLLSDRKRHILQQNISKLTHLLTLSDNMWMHLMRHEVITKAELINMKIGSTAIQIQKLVDLLLAGTKHQYNGFIRSLLDTNQKDVVKDIFGESPSDYLLTNAEMLITNTRLHQAILDLKEYYNDNLFKSPLHAFSTMSEEIDLQNVYTALDIIETQIGNNKKSSVPINESQTLIAGKDNKAHTLCVGDAGSGKSTLATRLAWLWAKQQTDSNESLGRFKAVIFIEHTASGICLKEIIKNSIPGSEVNKALVWDLLNDEPENVLVLVEAFDQFRDESVKEAIKSLVNSRITNMFVTARKDHSCLVPEFQSDFHQHIEVKGFTQDKRVEFAKKLLQEMNCKNNVEGFLETIGGKPKFEANPLNIMLACQLYAEGTIPSQAFDLLTEVELYTKTEERLVEREILKEKKVDEETLVKLRTEALEKVHKLAAYAILQHEYTCKKTDLDFYHIESNSPANVLLLEKRESSATCGDRHYWMWPHSRLREFDAAMGFAKMKNLKDSEWLQLIASQYELNPVTKLLSAILGINQRYEEVNILMTATILLQGKISCQDQHHACPEIAQIMHWLGQCNINEGFLFKKGYHLPNLMSVCDCCGSLFNENINLFQHVQYCWLIGLSENERTAAYEEMQLEAL